MSEPSRFSISRATEADLPEILKICWLCFPQHVRNKLMGCPTEEDLPRAVEFYTQVMREQHHTVWVKVVDDSTGKIAAAALWKIYLSMGAPSLRDEHPPPWLEGETMEASKKKLGELNEARRKANPDGFLYLHSCFTSSEYRRQGAGRLIMQWGCDVADALSIPTWIEASPQGQLLYKCYGFIDVGELPGSVIYMRREARTAQTKVA